MSNAEQHIWTCDLCGEELIVERDPTKSSADHERGIRGRLPKYWGTVTVSSVGGYPGFGADACPSCLEDVHICVKELKRG
jgi:hypothetical protein